MPAAQTQLTLQECRDILHHPDTEKLWPRVSGFLFRFQEQIHPQRVEALLGCVPSALLQDGTLACKKRLTEYLQEKLGIVSILHAFPREDLSRLLLLSPQWYCDLGERLELLSQEKQLRSLIRKEDVLKWKERYPGVYPEILRRTAFYTPWLPKLSTLPQVPYAGMRLLATILQGLPAELLKRQMLRFPVEMEGAFVPFSDSEWHCESTDTKMLVAVMKHDFTQEYSLCF